MSLERMTVSLEDFLKYLVKRWLVIISCVAVGIIAASLFAKTVGYAIVIPASENYEELKTQEEYFEDYIENSVTMEMNPLNIYENSIFVDGIADRNALKDFIDSGKVWDEFGDTLATRYLAELISWEETVFVDTAELKVQHSDAEQCVQLTDYVAKQIQIYDESLNISTGTQRTVIDESVSDVQMWYKNRLQDIKGQLEYTAEGCTIEISMVAAIISGAMAGGICSMFVLLLVFLIKPELRSDNEIAYYTKAQLLNEEQIITLIKNKKKAVLINLTEQEFSVTGLEVVCDVETAEASILSSDMILIAASANKTMYKELVKVLKFLNEKEKEIQGCIAC